MPQVPSESSDTSIPVFPSGRFLTAGDLHHEGSRATELRTGAAARQLRAGRSLAGIHGRRAFAGAAGAGGFRQMSERMKRAPAAESPREAKGGKGARTQRALELVAMR